MPQQQKISRRVAAAILEASRRTGIPVSVLNGIAAVESGFNPRARTGSYHGVYQLSRSEFSKYAPEGASIYDPEANVMVGAKLLKSHVDWFTKKYGRAPTATEAYLAHQQGRAGLAAHMANPDGVASENIRRYYRSDRMARLAVNGNLPKSARKQLGSNPTSRQFMDWWDGRIQRALGNEAPAGEKPSVTAEYTVIPNEPGVERVTSEPTAGPQPAAGQGPVASSQPPASGSLAEYTFGPGAKILPNGAVPPAPVPRQSVQPATPPISSVGPAPSPTAPAATGPAPAGRRQAVPPGAAGSPVSVNPAPIVSNQPAPDGSNPYGGVFYPGQYESRPDAINPGPRISPVADASASAEGPTLGSVFGLFGPPDAPPRDQDRLGFSTTAGSLTKMPLGRNLIGMLFGGFFGGGGAFR